jgi:amino acid permease
MEQWEVIVAAFGINCMAYNCHLNLFPCLESLRNCTLRRGHYLGALTICTSFLLYNGLGLITYLDKFDDLGPASVLEFFDKTNPFTIITTCGVILVLVASSPAVCWSLRNSVNILFFKGTPVSNLRWVVIGGSIALLAAFLASTSENVLLFFHLVGGLVTPVIILLLPVLFYLKCKTDPPIGMKLLAICTGVFSVLGSIVSTYGRSTRSYTRLKRMRDLLSSRIVSQLRSGIHKLDRQPELTL